jgi:hypothetical protein
MIKPKNTGKNYLVIPEYDPLDPKPYPGDIKPGYYTRSEVRALIKKHLFHPFALYFIRDMLEK